MHGDLNESCRGWNICGTFCILEIFRPQNILTGYAGRGPFVEFSTLGIGVFRPQESPSYGPEELTANTFKID